jgi:hypothetical protein
MELNDKEQSQHIDFIVNQALKLSFLAISSLLHAPVSVASTHQCIHSSMRSDTMILWQPYIYMIHM